MASAKCPNNYLIIGDFVAVTRWTLYSLTHLTQ